MGDDSVKMVYIKRLRGWLSGRSLPGRGGGGGGAGRHGFNTSHFSV